MMDEIWTDEQICIGLEAIEAVVEDWVEICANKRAECAAKGIAVNDDSPFRLPDTMITPALLNDMATTLKYAKMVCRRAR
jgi:hypothetical protein